MTCKMPDSIPAKYWRPRPELNRGARFCSPCEMQGVQDLDCKTAKKPPTTFQRVTRVSQKAKGAKLASFAKANERPLFELVLRPEPRVNSDRALRTLLKFVLRSYGLRCISIKRVRPK